MSNHHIRWTARAARPVPCAVAKFYTSRNRSMALVGHASDGGWLRTFVPAACNELHLSVVTVLLRLDSLQAGPEVWSPSALLVESTALDRCGPPACVGGQVPPWARLSERCRSTGLSGFARQLAMSVWNQQIPAVLVGPPVALSRFPDGSRSSPVNDPRRDSAVCGSHCASHTRTFDDPTIEFIWCSPGTRAVRLPSRMWRCSDQVRSSPSRFKSPPDEIWVNQLSTAGLQDLSAPLSMRSGTDGMP